MAIFKKPFEFKPEMMAHVIEYANKKQPPRVVTQRPGPGTPVLEGMTIEIHAVSDSDVPVGILDADIPPLVTKVTIADMVEMLDSDPDFKNAVLEGKSNPLVTEKLNRELNQRGVTGGLSVEEAGVLMKSLKGLGFGG